MSPSRGQQNTRDSRAITCMSSFSSSRLWSVTTPSSPHCRSPPLKFQVQWWPTFQLRPPDGLLEQSSVPHCCDSPHGNLDVTNTYDLSPVSLSSVPAGLTSHATILFSIANNHETRWLDYREWFHCCAVIVQTRDFDDHSQREGWMTPALMASWVGTTFGIISAFDFDSDPTWRREGYDLFSSMFGITVPKVLPSYLIQCRLTCVYTC